ncbi:MAG: HD domain-containing protein [Gemmatimonadetes bacterium]|nr:HD domain-containing protein [Gemmatimonadota bacterium]
MTGIPAWAEATPERRAHIERVAALAGEWADALRVPANERARWQRAAYLHDALKDAPAERLAPHAPAGWNLPDLFHGPAAAARAAQDGETDQGVLDAVAYHSVGYGGWDAAGRMLYLADFLEPGRVGQEQRAGLAARVIQDPDAVLTEVAALRMVGLIRSGWPLVPEMVAFWNSVARPG